MKKGLIVAIAAIIVIVGGYAVLHKSNSNTSNQNSSKVAKTTSSTLAVNNAVLITKTSSSLGKYLAEPSGQALYTYGGDSEGTSNCTGSCLATWPAYQDTGSTSNLPTGVSTIKRSDNGEIQYTYNGMPLYIFASDSNGQATGNGVADFSIAKPSSTVNSTSSKPATNNDTAAASSNSYDSSSSSSW